MSDATRTWISFDSPEAPAVATLRRWWAVLQKDTGARAALRRLANPVDCAFERAFHGLRRDMLKVGRVNDDALAVVAVLAANVRVEARGRLPDRLGAPKGDGHVLPELRLQRLLQADTPEDLLRQMRRVLALLDNRADIADLARWVYPLALPELAHDRAARQFAYAYYGAVAPDPEDPDAARIADDDSTDSATTAA